MNGVHMTLDPACIRLIATLVPGIFLVCLDRWLRARRVQDPTAIWLFLGLFSWSVRAIFENPGWMSAETLSQITRLPVDADNRAELVAYLFSPLTTILFTVAAFQLSRVKDLIEDYDLAHVRRICIWGVAALSLTGWTFLVTTKHLTATRFIDAGASYLALTLLGLGLAYSFYKYAHPLFVLVTALTFSSLIWRQITNATSGLVNREATILIASATDLTLGLLFVALGMAWGVSESSRLRIVGSPHSVRVAAVFLDVRGSTAWANRTNDNVRVITFMNSLRDLAHAIGAQHFRRRPSLTKFLGDGYLLVWEGSHNHEPEFPAQALAYALALRLEFNNFINQLISQHGYPEDLPVGVGIGVEIGEALRLTHESGAYDYIGLPLNNSAKFQSIARPTGVVTSKSTFLRLPQPIRDSLTNSGVLDLGPDNRIEVRATDDVRLPTWIGKTPRPVPNEPRDVHPTQV